MARATSSAPGADGRGPRAPDPVDEMLARVRRLELVARKNAAGLRAGEYQSAVRGQGLAFYETRKYVPGEPARHIDWNITARLARPHVRVHLEERQRDVFVALDTSPSMHAGSGRRTKLEYAVELAATLAVSVIDAGDRLGHVLFADRELAASRPRSGRGQLFRVLRSILDHVEPWQRPVSESDPRAALQAIARHRGGMAGAGGGSAIFLISDFVDHDLPEDLKYVRARHEVALLHVYDPFEFDSGPVVFRGRSPEGSRADAALRSAETGSLEAMRAYLRERGAKVGMAVESLDTRSSVPAALGRVFHGQRRKRGRTRLAVARAADEPT